MVPAYLMCLTDSQQLQMAKTHVGALLPLLNHQQACHAKDYLQTLKDTDDSIRTHPRFVPVSCELAEDIGDHAFALTMSDDSMEPELRRHDVLVIDPDKWPKPGHFVVAKIDDNETIVVRRYKQLIASRQVDNFELLAVNPHWGSVRCGENTRCVLIGTVVYLYRKLE